MNLSNLLRAAAIIGACIWSVVLIKGWMSMPRVGGVLCDRNVGPVYDCFGSFVFEHIMVFFLFIGGIFVESVKDLLLGIGTLMLSVIGVVIIIGVLVSL